MAERSRPWDGIVTGDAGPYSDDQWSDTWLSHLAPTITSEGVFFQQLNELVMTAPGGISPVLINTGRAMVDGTWYESDVSISNAIGNPAVDPRIDRFVLRKSWAAQTIRLARLQGGEAPAPGPAALTQVDGVTWEIPLGQFFITVGGAITLYRDERIFLGQYNPALVATRDLMVLNDDFFEGVNYLNNEARRHWTATIPAGNSIGPTGAAGNEGRGVLFLNHRAAAAEPVHLICQADFSLAGSNNVILEVIAREPNTDANLDRVIGFTSDPNVILAAEMVAFYNDFSIDANWHAITRTGGVSAGTDIDTGIALSNTFKLLEIRNFGTDSVTFLIDGVVVATHTANIPGAIIGPLALQIRGAGGAPVAQNYQFVDWLHYEGRRP